MPYHFQSLSPMGFRRVFSKSKHGDMFFICFFPLLTQHRSFISSKPAILLNCLISTNHTVPSSSGISDSRPKSQRPISYPNLQSASHYHPSRLHQASARRRLQPGTRLPHLWSRSLSCLFLMHTYRCK